RYQVACQQMPGFQWFASECLLGKTSANRAPAGKLNMFSDRISVHRLRCLKKRNKGMSLPHD
ncbi:MAG: hypothetical protein KDA87_23655, partial [Planctomycetales bacterium]|nr:hypothetical protein [Planctomycetales bacterium]